ncbi:MAG: hypothetical protein GXP43_02005 [bacterium]|nr:hypothetical protein [bacterium]
MKRIIATHINPDLDALAACWLIKRYWNEWGDAEIKFVPAGSLYTGSKGEEVVHVDTGGGEFDHHQAGGVGRLSSAAELVFKKRVKTIKWLKDTEKEALRRMIQVITEIDNFRELTWPGASEDRYDFGLHEIVNAWSGMYADDSQRVVAMGFAALDAVLVVFKNKVRAEGQIKEKGWEFESKWGKGLAIESGNSYIEHLAQKMGYVVVVRRHPKKGFVRITARWDKDVDLTEVYERLKNKDPRATWFLHASKCMVLNGARSNPKMTATKLSLEEVVGEISEKLI